MGLPIFGGDLVGRIIEIAARPRPGDIVKEDEQRLAVTARRRLDGEQLMIDGVPVVVAVDEPGVHVRQLRHRCRAELLHEPDRQAAGCRPAEHFELGRGIDAGEQPLVRARALGEQLRHAAIFGADLDHVTGVGEVERGQDDVGELGHRVDEQIGHRVG